MSTGNDGELEDLQFSFVIRDEAPHDFLIESSGPYQQPKLLGVWSPA